MFFLCGFLFVACVGFSLLEDAPPVKFGGFWCGFVAMLNRFLHGVQRGWVGLSDLGWFSNGL